MADACAAPEDCGQSLFEEAWSEYEQEQISSGNLRRLDRVDKGCAWAWYARGFGDRRHASDCRLSVRITGLDSFEAVVRAAKALIVGPTGDYHRGENTLRSCVSCRDIADLKDALARLEESRKGEKC